MPGSSTLAAPQAPAAALPVWLAVEDLQASFKMREDQMKSIASVGVVQGWSVALRALEETECVILFISASRDITELPY
jgi:hypothetical protein